MTVREIKQMHPSHELPSIEQVRQSNRIAEDNVDVHEDEELFVLQTALFQAIVEAKPTVADDLLTEYHLDLNLRNVVSLLYKVNSYLINFN